MHPALTHPPSLRKTVFMVSILFTLNAIICVALIILILLQRSESGSGGMFGGTGGGGQAVVRNPLARPTAILAGLFLLFSVLVAVLNKGGSHEGTVMTDGHAAPAPALPEAALMPSAASAIVPAAPAASPTEVPTVSPTEAQ
jgi:preprotein translocase subunit SecG